MTHTVETIRHLLLTNDQAVGRALVALNARQTATEQAIGATVEHNNRGFTGGHAKRGTGMANFYLKAGFLTPKQINWWRAKTPSGRSRIEIYAAQLLQIAQEKGQKAS